MVHAHDFDAVVCLVGCDKTTPAALMALARVNKPAVVLYSGFLTILVMLFGAALGWLIGAGIGVAKKAVTHAEPADDEDEELAERELAV